jgi:hypothetical protein
MYGSAVQKKKSPIRLDKKGSSKLREIPSNIYRNFAPENHRNFISNKKLNI